MRLTLRTMLAYLDDLLEPADRADIGKKLADSEFAQQLVERIRNRSRNPRLGSPKLSGKGMALDPNTVAEYLDNTLAAERVPEFEKMCLPPAEAGQDLVESDVYLAEVAACHQILAMVLGQPAQVDPQMKRQMYGIINQAPPAVPERMTADAAEEIGLEHEDERVRPARHRPEIPDYLRDRGPRSSWKPIIAAIVLFALLVGAITMALGPIDQLLGLNQPAKNTVANNANPAKEQPVAAAEQPGDRGAAAAPGNGAASEAADAATAGSANPASVVRDRPANSPTAPPTAGSAEPSSVPPASGDARLPAESHLAASTSGPNVTASGSGNSVESGNPPPLPQPSVSPADAKSTSDHSVEGMRSAASNVAPTPNDATLSPPVAPTASPATVPNTTPPVDETPLGKVVLGKDVVLLKFDPASSHWMRLPAGSAVSGGDQLLVLPTYRPTITLSVGITLQVPSETMLTLGAANSEGVPSIKILYGRLVAMTTGKAGARLRIDVGANSGVITFTDADALLGIEVHRYFLAGVNPELEEPHVAAALYAASGHADWTGQDGSTANLTAPQRWPLTPPMPDVPTVDANSPAAIPKWISGDQLNANDARASEALATLLDADKPLMIALREMATHRRVEYRAFAAQCLAILDQFEPLVSMLTDPEQRPMWPLEIQSIKAALARSPATAAAVREAFQKQRGDEAGKDLYRMFLGYTKDQLRAGEAARLVEYLDHDNLDFRVLAFTNLQQITGKSFLYQPDATAAAREQPFKRWQDALRTGAIVPKETVPR